MSEYNYCPGCGAKLNREVEEAEVHETETQTEQITDSAVEIARIEANRDVAVAKINAGVVEHSTEVEQAAELAHAEGKAEGLETALAPEPEPAPEPVVVVNDDAPEEPSIPPAEPEEHHEPPKPKHKSGFFGF
jgi:hypothetical protein